MATGIFYSVGIAGILVLTGIVPLSGLTIYEMMHYVFPVMEEHYWFVTAYIFLYLLAPLMNGTLRGLPEKTYRQGISSCLYCCLWARAFCR